MAPTLRSKGKQVASPPSEDYAPNAEILEAKKLEMVNGGANTSRTESDYVGFYHLMPVGAKTDEVFKVPLHIYQKLKPHQMEGLAWLWNIHCNEPGGLVADDMGLGKTRQTVTFLLGLLSSDIIHMALIISPVSILDSWVKELGKVGLDDISYIYQTSDGSLDTVLEKGGILLTNYEMYTKQSRTLGSPDNKWDYVVLDEAHRIKNMDAHVTRTICNIHCRKTNLVTGTPFARNIEDVYALINFIRPNILGNKAMFKKNYISTVDLGQYSNSREVHKEKYLKALARCRNIISPYILRRNKTVLIENGDLESKKTEVIVWLKLTDTQIKLYKLFYKLYGSEAGFRPQDANSFPLTTLSRLISIDPHLLLKTRDEGKNNVVGAMAENLLRSIGIDDAKYQDIQISCKISFVMDLIENILSEDREEEENERNRGEENGKRMKILVFSQHMHVLDIIEEYLGTNMEGFNLFRIDGSVLKPRRDAKIEEFNKEEGSTIFLLSARVGAGGLNLVAATRVIIVDPAWNLSDDNQISDRVYRIGQTKDVVIYRLFTCGTIEDHMFKLQLIKGITAHALIEGKICDPLVRKEDGNVFVLPKTFDYSKICNSLRREFGDTVDLDRKHQTFLRTHHLVKGIADHKLVFSKAKNLADVPLSDSSSEEEISAQKQKCSKSAMEKEKLPKSVVPWNSRLRKQCSLEQATSKQEDAEPILVQEMMEIPADKVRMLLANGAERLRQIQRQSCATIRAEIQKDPRHVAHGVVKLTGTQKEIEIAQQLVNAMITSADQAKDLSPVKIIFVPIPTYMIGRIIGKHGNNVKSMIEKSGADIKVLGTESKCKLTGSSESIESAQQLIKDMISNTERTKDMSPVKTVVVPIPTDMVGRIIGKDGERVKSMIKKSGANIQILDTESKCKLTGSSESIECARSLISDVIEKAQKVVHSPWPTFRGSRVLPPPLSHSPIVRPLLPWQPGGDFQPPVIRAPCHFSQDPTQPMRPRHPWQPNFDARPAQYVRPPEYGAPPRPCGDQGPPPE